MSIAKSIIWGIICLTMGFAVIQNFSTWDSLNLWAGSIIAIVSGIMSYLEYK